MECGLLGLADRSRSEDLATTGTGKRRFSEAQSAGTRGSPIRRGEKWPARQSPAGPWPVQLRYHSGLTSEQYVNAEAWCAARLERCPNHPHGGCSFARHGTYSRKTPVGTRIARCYCPESHTTFSLLPDCLAARLPGTLAELEAVVAAVEQTPSLISAADQLRSDEIELPGALRWLRRRVRLVHNALRHVLGLLPDSSRAAAPTWPRSASLWTPRRRCWSCVR